MKEKSTDGLREELMNAPSIDTYISDNQACFSSQNITDLLDTLYHQRSISKAALARKAGISEVYLHQVFSGRRKPSRDRLLCLCIGMEVTIDETQRLLMQASYGLLYPKIKRDAIISHGIIHHVPLSEIHDKLFAEQEKTLC